MDVTTLKEKVRAALKNGSFSISGATLASTELTTLLTAAWGKDELALTGAKETRDDATGITVGGTLPALAKLTNHPVTATFRVDSGRVALRVELDKIPSLALSRCFAELDSDVFARCALTNVTLALDSAKRPPLPDRFPEGFDLPCLPDAIRKRTVLGLGLSGTFSPGTATDDVLAWLLPKGPYPVSGALALPVDQLGVAVTARTADPVTVLGRFRVSSELTFAAAALAHGDELLGVTNLMHLTGTVTADVGDSRSLCLPFSARLTTSTPSVLTLPCLPKAGTAIGLGEIGKLLGTSVEDHLKDLPALSGGTLRRLDVTLAPRERKVLAIGATVGWTPSGTVGLFDGLLTVRELEVSVDHFPSRPPGQRLAVEVTGKVTVKNCALTVRWQLPSRAVSAELAPNCTDDITDLVRSIAKDLPLPALSGADLLISGLGGGFRLRAALPSSWRPFGSAVKVELRDLTLDLARIAGAVTASIGATMKFGDVTLHGVGAYDFTAKRWRFGFTTPTGISLSVDSLVKELASVFGAQPPGDLPSMTVDAFALDFTTGDKSAYVLTCAASVAVTDTPLRVAVEVTKEKCAARLALGDFFFEGAVTGGKLGLSWTASGDRSAGLRDLVAALGVTDPGLPRLLDVRVTSAALVVDKDKGVAWSATTGHGRICGVALSTSKKWCLLVDAPVSAGLSRLPAVGPYIPPEVDVRISDVRFTKAGARFDGAADAANALLKAVPGISDPPTVPSDATARYCVRVAIGRESAWYCSTTTQPHGAELVSTRSKAVTAWHTVDKRLGPLSVHRLGVRIKDGKLWLMVDGGLSLAGITISALGLGIGFPPGDPSRVEYALDGLAVGYANPPLRITGALSQRTPPEHYDLMLVGLLTLTTPKIGMALIGSYAVKDDGTLSFFLFGELSGLKIGEPPVMLEGLTAGVGYNSAVVVPPVESIADFPLVAGLTDPDRFPVEQEPHRVIEAVVAHITPEPGRMWLAAGAHLSLFEFIDLKALLLLQVGVDFTLHLLGLATATFPKVRQVKPYARVVLQLRASYQAATGEIAVRGLITRDSFLLHPDCRLTGGFALCAWAPPSPHRGDFVLTVGGYHPDYTPPRHFPVVPRVGLDWRLSGSLTITGQWYAALTPAAFMLGGKLDVDFHAKAAHAWLHAELNALIQWEPFSYDVLVGVRAGAELNVPFHPRVEVGVDVRLWGPPTGGTATFHLPVGGSVTARFGEPRPGAPKWLEWDEFHARVLNKAGVELLPADGVGPRAPDTPADAPWLVSVSGFAFVSQAPTPISEAKLTTPGKPGPDSVALPSGRCPFAARPMRSAPITATHSVTIRRADTRSAGPVLTWRVEPVTGNVAASVWGPSLDEPTERPKTTAPLLLDQVLGLRVTVPAPVHEETLPTIPEENLQVKNLTTARKLPIGTTADGPVPRRPVTPATRDTIATTLGSTANDRAALHRALLDHGVAPSTTPPAAPTDYANRVWTYLTEDPLIVTGGPR
ncbi:DUF6603 domain-containing protein [Saccharothrix sp. NPDC042600]|uniref:DUF6603 domain-containing protein n=1 Tax=Saccharothrix TaxID=2071 RepID=UPI0033C25A44|nr:hypothetical protein GCM10017745_37170 [Saccharothrix mutabilis subsp. capreolus]